MPDTFQLLQICINRCISMVLNYGSLCKSHPCAIRTCTKHLIRCHLAEGFRSVLCGKSFVWVGVLVRDGIWTSVSYALLHFYIVYHHIFVEIQCAFFTYLSTCKNGTKLYFNWAALDFINNRFHV